MPKLKKINKLGMELPDKNNNIGSLKRYNLIESESEEPVLEEN